MKTQIITTKLSTEEKETHLHNEGDFWIMESFNAKIYNLALKRDWVPEVVYQYTDGTICGYRLRGNSYALSIRSNHKRASTLTEEQRAQAAERMRNIRSSKSDI